MWGVTPVSKYQYVNLFKKNLKLNLATLPPKIPKEKSNFFISFLHYIHLRDLKTLKKVEKLSKLTKIENIAEFVGNLAKLALCYVHFLLYRAS